MGNFNFVVLQNKKRERILFLEQHHVQFRFLFWYRKTRLKNTFWILATFTQTSEGNTKRNDSQYECNLCNFSIFIEENKIENNWAKFFIFIFSSVHSYFWYLAVFINKRVCFVLLCNFRIFQFFVAWIGRSMQLLDQI